MSKNNNYKYDINIQPKSNNDNRDNNNSRPIKQFIATPLY